MNRIRISCFGLLLALALGGLAHGASPSTLVACAPGFPGSTEEAQLTMNDLAALVREGVAAYPALAAVYHPQLEPGLDRLKLEDAVAAIVPLPLYLTYREELGLEPIALMVNNSGPRSRYSLVAAKGAALEPAALSGWTLAGIAGYAPEFVRGIALSQWGVVSGEAEIQFTKRPLSVLRRAARGESVAALLDAEQTDAMSSLPFADQLEIVTQSPELFAGFACNVRGRMDAQAAEALAQGFLALDRTEEGVGLLKTMGLKRFEPVPEEELAALEQAFAEKTD